MVIVLGGHPGTTTQEFHDGLCKLTYAWGSGQGSGLGSGVSLGGPGSGRKREDSDSVRNSHRRDVRSCDWKMVRSDPRPYRRRSRNVVVFRQWNITCSFVCRCIQRRGKWLGRLGVCEHGHVVLSLAPV